MAMSQNPSCVPNKNMVIILGLNPISWMCFQNLEEVESFSPSTAEPLRCGTAFFSCINGYRTILCPSYNMGYPQMWMLVYNPHEYYSYVHIIFHSCWSYIHQLSHRFHGAPHCIYMDIPIYIAIGIAFRVGFRNILNIEMYWKIPPH